MLLKRRKSQSPDEPSRPRGLMGRLRTALTRTRGALVDGIASLLAGGRPLDATLVEEIETVLLSADVGIEATERIVTGLRERVKRDQADGTQAVLDSLREDMLAILQPVAQPLALPANPPRPFAILMVGINGAGKTTSIGKLAHRFRQAGQSVMLAAGDTFRAAAIEQLQTWGERNEVPVISQHTGADAASVIYDGLHSAQARDIDVFIADTAGRLHTQAGLMEELKKVRRVMGKLDGSAPHETLLVIDAGTGQNALTQAREFHDAIGVSGIIVTKLDGTAKGGIVFAIAERLGIPIRFVGVGEGLDDLRDFDAGEFVDSLLQR